MIVFFLFKFYSWFLLWCQTVHISSCYVKDAIQKHTVQITSDGTRIFNDLKQRQSTNNVYKKQKDTDSQPSGLS